MIPELPQLITRISRARLTDQRLVDIFIDDGLVTDILPALSSRPAESDPEILDLNGQLLLAAPAEPHAHLDKAQTFDLINPIFGDLRSAITSWARFAPNLTMDAIAARAETQALSMVANGTTAIRTHVNIHPGVPPAGVEALVRVRSKLSKLVDIQIVALPDWRTPDNEITDALDLGLDFVGGAPHHSTNPCGEVDRMVKIAEKHCLGTDLHIDEHLDGPICLDHFARLVGRLSTNHLQAASHCVRLGTLPADQRDAVIEQIHRADLSVITLPATNLYLQGRTHTSSVPRGLTALRALIDAGVRVAAGADNVRDPFNPVGRSDAFETASLLVTAGHLTLDEAWHLVTNGARTIMGLPVCGPYVGAQADLLAVPSANLGQAIAEGPADRLVLRRGYLVARSTLNRVVARTN